jgi:hypothetical protein
MRIHDTRVDKLLQRLFSLHKAQVQREYRKRQHRMVNGEWSQEYFV